MICNRRFEIKNLGVIKSGSFEVKPLTLFCGPNNSGKTWAMYSLYSFLEYTLSLGPSIPKEIINALREQTSYQFNIIDWLQSKSEEIVDGYNIQVSKSLPELFNIPSKTFQDASFGLVMDTDDWTHALQTSQKRTYTHKSKKGTVRLVKSEGEEIIDIFHQGANEYLLERSVADFLEKFIANWLFPGIDSADIFLMPAERNGLHLFFRELSSRRTALLHHASKENIDIRELLRDVISSRYAVPIADYIDWLNNVAEIKKTGKGEFHNCAEKLKKLAGGVYKVDARTSDITFKPYQKQRDGKSTKPLGLHTTSSAVKSLFGLWFYLEHQAKPGDTLMIDEPELNIHPENQRKLARFFATLVNAGLNIVISTHSDYMVREFNSLIMLNRDKDKKLREKHDYAEEEVLEPEKVGAYLFDKQKIEAFEITSEDGIYATTFDDVIRDLNRVNNDIYYSLKEAQDE